MVHIVTTPPQAHHGTAPLVDVAVLCGVPGETQSLEGGVRGSLQQLVEDVEASLSRLLFNHTGFL